MVDTEKDAVRWTEKKYNVKVVTKDDDTIKLSGDIKVM